MSNKRIVFFVALLLGLSGCAPMFDVLSPDQKRDFYERVIEEAQSHRERAQFFEQQGFLAKALEEYEKGLFFGDIAGVDAMQVEQLKKRIEVERQAAYSRAKRALRQQKNTAALIEFNAVLKTDPQFEDAQQQFDLLLKKPENAALLTEKSNQLDQLLSQKQPSNKQLNQRDQKVKEVLSYRHNHPVALAYLVKQYENSRQEKTAGMVYLRQAREALAQNDLAAAESGFKKAQTFSATQKEGTRGLVQLQKRKDAIYLTALAKNALAADQTLKAEGYLKKALAAESSYQPAQVMLADIRKQRSVAQASVRLTTGRELLQEGEYIKARDEADAILRDDPKHPGALSLKSDANKAIKNNIARLLKEGELFFDQNRFDEAIERFETVLSVEADNTVCKTYLVRINKRRETLEMLNR